MSTEVIVMLSNRIAQLKIRWMSIGITLLASSAAQALDRDGMWRMMGNTVRSDDKGDTAWFLIVAVLLMLAAIVLARRYYQVSRRRGAAGRTTARVPRTFAEQAGSMGFRPLEVTNLRRIARRLAGGADPVSVLATSSGRQFLTADLRKRIRRREKEIELLSNILKKLGAKTGHDFHDREEVRVETDLAIWLVEKSDEQADGDDEVIVDIAPTAARLADLSEGGAAIVAGAKIEPEGLVEFWSAYSQYWIPPTQAGVVSCRPTDDGAASVSLHFLDPPRTEIRRAIQEIQRDEREELEDMLNSSDVGDLN